ncbi:MAG: amidohydrolase family protein [Lacunisphaera sp.]|nr:amidohydrolase family protein [Lacunisphaera sp.]
MRVAFLISRGLAPLAAAVFASTVSAKDLVIHAGTLLDGVSAVPQHKVSILVHDDRITAVAPGFQAPAGAEIIDLSSQTVMPGFIDCHVHIAGKLPSQVNSTEDWLTHSDIDRAFDGAVFCRAMLQQGFTTARDVGGGDDTVAVRNAINAGKIAGPRLWVSLEPLGPTAGHGDPQSGLDAGLSHPGWTNGIVNTPEEARLRVREHRRRGADLIKIMPSGGIASTGDNPHQQLMTDEEMRVAVATAHALGLKVAAHIYPAGAIEAAVRAGVDSVEHGSFATPQTYALMKEHKTYLVPTLAVFDVYYTAARDHPELLAPGTAAKELANDLFPKKNFPAALKAGVAIAYGTDLGEGNHAMDFGLMISCGMAPADALFAATRNAADLIGAADRIGSIQPGRFADLVAAPGDPLSDPTQFEKVSFVMKGGTVYRQGGHPTLAAAQ